MTNLAHQLEGHRVIGLDTSIFIYHLEANSKYVSFTGTILQHIQSGRSQGVISTVTVMELTVHPWRMNRADVARQYEILLVNFPNLRLVDVNREVARRGAQLRAKYNLRPADALQVATAMVNDATVWISNDKKLRRLEAEIEIILLDEI